MANIMIVDDSPIIRISLRHMLEEMGHRVVAEAGDGREALNVYKEREVDLITMDIQLPGIDGIEAVRLIRERNPQAVIVMISSVEYRSKVYEAIKQGAKHYIVKPFTESKVREVVDSVLGTQPQPADKPSEDAEPAAGFADEPVEKPREEKSRFAKKPVKLELSVPELATLPFELVMKDGRAMLTVQRHISDSNVAALHSCLLGLLYFRKMKYIVELWEPIQHDQGLKLLLDFAFAVRRRNGTVGIITSDIGLFTHLKSKLQSGVYRSHAEIEW